MVQRTLFLAAAIIGTLITQAHAAAYISPALGLIDDFTLVVEALDRDSQRCGLSQTLIQNAIRYPVVKSGLKIVAGGSPAIFDVLLGTKVTLNGSTCVTSCELKISIYLPVAFKDKSFSGEVLLWEDGGFVVSPLHQHADRMRSELEQDAKDIIVNWSDAKNGDFNFPHTGSSEPR